MNKFILSMVLVCFVCVRGFSSEASFPEVIREGDTLLVRSGVGTLSKWFIKGCDIALYAEAETKKSAILDDFPKCLELYYYRTIKSDQFAVAAWETLRKGWDEKRRNAEKSAIDRIHALYKDVSKGDRYRLIYIPDVGTRLFLNGKSLGCVEGAGFAEVYFSIWIGKTPMDLKLRDMLTAGLK